MHKLKQVTGLPFHNTSYFVQRLKYLQGPKIMKKYFRNFILCGEIDFHCILCHESLMDIEAVDNHVKLEKHRKLIKSNYEHKFKKELIYKIGIGKYYCELCNNLATDASEHKITVTHINNKLTTSLDSDNDVVIKRNSDGTYKVGELLLNWRQWHGINREICTMCKKPAYSIAHVASEEHVLNLINTRTKTLGDNYYRQLSFNQAYCFICTQVFSLKLIDNHLIKCQIKKNNLQGQINVENSQETVYDDHVDNGKRRSDLAKYGRENFIKLNEAGKWAYCELCDIPISAHMKQTLAHVEGKRHINFLELTGLKNPSTHTKPNCSKQKLTAFLIHIEKKDDTYSIRSSVSIETLSFLLIATKCYHTKKRKCFACDVFVYDDELVNHLKSKTHKDKVLACHVILHPDKYEFIRMIRPNVFHCGVCNLIFPYWESLFHHITNIKHKVNKSYKFLKPLYNLNDDIYPKIEKLNISLERLGLI